LGAGPPPSRHYPSRRCAVENSVSLDRLCGTTLLEGEMR
jgi:hypothetical protein